MQKEEGLGKKERNPPKKESLGKESRGTKDIKRELEREKLESGQQKKKEKMKKREEGSVTTHGNVGEVEEEVWEDAMDDQGKQVQYII